MNYNHLLAAWLAFGLGANFLYNATHKRLAVGYPSDYILFLAEAIAMRLLEIPVPFFAVSWLFLTLLITYDNWKPIKEDVTFAALLQANICAFFVFWPVSIWARLKEA